MPLPRVVKAYLSWSLLASLIFSLAVSCGNVKEGYIGGGNPVEIDLDSSTNHYSIPGIVDSLKAIDLETNDSSVISDVSSVHRIIYKDNKYFILDERFMSIKVFDSTGKYLYDVGKLGIGKGEYQWVTDVEFYAPHNSLLVLCTRPRKIVEFTLKGNFLKESNLDFWASGFVFPSANERIFYINQNKSDVSGDKNILFTDSNNDVKGKMFDLPKNISFVVRSSGGLYSTGRDIYFNPAFSNTYYLMVNDTANPVFKINYGSKNIPPGIRETDLFNKLKNYSFQYGTFVKFKDYVGFNYCSDRVSSAFVNIHSGKVFTSDIKSDSLNMLFSNSMFECDGRLIMVLDINRLSGFLQRNAKTIQQRFPDLYAHIRPSKTQQNPILLTFALKAI